MKQTGRKLLSILLAMLLAVGLFSAVTLTALATNYSDETWYVTKNDDGAITKIEYQFTTSDTAQGTWYMYLWEIGDTSGDNGRPEILDYATLKSGNGDHTMVITYTGEPGKAYNIGTVLKDSRWSTETSTDGWPYITNACDWKDCSSADNIYVNNEKTAGTLKDALSPEPGKENPTVTAPAENTLTYTGEAQELVTAGSTTGGEMQYSLDGETYSTTIPTGTNAGDYTVYYKVKGDNDYYDVSAKTVTVRIAKADSSVTTAPIANTLTYTGGAQELVTEGVATGGTLQYAIGTDETTAPTDGWSTDLPTGTNAGTYYVWYKVVGDENHNDTEPVCVPVTISNPTPQPSVTTYPVNVSDTENGTVKADKTRAAKNAKVTLSITPDEGYEADKVTVTDKDGKVIPVTKNDDGTYSFQMPKSPVNVSVTYKEAKKAPASPEQTGVADWLITDEHPAFFSGYEDGSIRPEGNITRAEVATIFYRLLKNQDVEITVSFPDVNDGDWYAAAVNTLASLKIITGYEDGTFAPDKQISRAEFSAIATRFAKATGGKQTFADVEAGYWAEDNIATAYDLSLIHI